MSVLAKRFVAPGPTVAAMMNCDKLVVGIMGPQGAGKTTGVIVRLLEKAAMQRPSPLDGIARYRCIVWMRTYRELWSKVIPDWQEWAPAKGPGISWIGGRDNPAEHEFKFQVIDGGEKKIVQAQVWFRAIGDQTAQEAAKGLHGTDFWLPEATAATREMYEAAIGRLGRYPSMDHGGPVQRQLFCDWNAGDPYNWTSKLFIYKRTENVGFFRQPGGREPNAENIPQLAPGYYDQQVIANAGNPDWIRRMVDNKIGFMRDGMPVFPSFDETAHVAKSPLPLWPGLPLIIAADAGLTPALLIGQKNKLGEWRVHREIVAHGGTGAIAFAKALNRVLAEPMFARHPIKPSEAWADPASGNPTEASDEDENAVLKTWMAIMSEETGLQWKPSRCRNDPEIRRAAVRTVLDRRIEQRPGLQIDPRCERLIMSLARDYKFAIRKIETGAGTEYEERPVKNSASHVADAAQYLFANGGEQDEATGRGERKARREAAKARRRASRPRRVDPLSGYERRA